MPEKVPLADNRLPQAHGWLYKQIVRQMVLRTFCVINNILLRERKANQVCFLDRGQSVRSNVAVPCRILSVAHMWLKDI